ncbi:MAG: nucleoside-diphosphate sugar epimerase/dehydratase [Pseudomonadota bacterium]
MLRKFNYRALFAFLHDVAASAATWWFGYWLRFNFDIPPQYMATMFKTLVLIVPVQGAVFYFFGLYRGIWRYASLPDMRRIFTSVTVAILAVALLLYMARFNIGVPRSVVVMQPLLLVLIMCGSRVAYRSWKESRLYSATKNKGEPVLVLGAGDAAVTLVKELAKGQEWRVVGLLDDNRGKQGRFLHGVRVLGPLDELARWAKHFSISDAIIAMPSASRATRRRAIDLCNNAGLTIMTVPSYADLVSGNVTVSQIRKIDVEDLLGRDPVMLDTAGLHEFLSGQVVMVTGAGGSIGAELCRQIAGFRPSLLIFFELNEFALYRLQEEFIENFAHIPTIGVIGDVKNRVRVQQVIQGYLPSVIFHAAAYKHVPLMEEVNAWEAVRNNVLGTYTVAQVAIASNVKKVVLVSTDKAVNPTNVMGASKRLAEIVCQLFQFAGKTQFEIVRFGNVLGSTGSVIPKFQEQIAKGGPITVTHPDIIRYFMSIPEAAQLVLQAGCMGRGGEVFVMDMGEPTKIVNLAKEMIRLAGHTEEEIKIVYSGLRPGEKLFEELLADDETTVPSGHPKLRIAKSTRTDSVELNELSRWLEQPQDLSDDEVKRDLRQWVPEYFAAVKPKLKVVQAFKE